MRRFWAADALQEKDVEIARAEATVEGGRPRHLQENCRDLVVYRPRTRILRVLQSQVRRFDAA